MEALFIKLINMSITAGYIVIAALLMRPLLKKAPKWISMLLWLFVALRLVIPFGLESALSLIPSSQTIPSDITVTDTPAIDSGMPLVNGAVNNIISESLSPNVGDGVNPIQVITALASVIWISGMVIMLLYAIISFLRLRFRVREAVKVDGAVYSCDRISSPFILGIFSPKIYLNSDLDKEDASYVIAHEKAHIARFDHLWKPFGYMLLTVYWFNPVLWAAYFFMCKDIELACDEKVIKQLGVEVKKPYSNALINCSISHRAISACPLAFGEVGVKERVKRVLNYKKPALLIVITAFIACAAVAVCLLTNPMASDESESACSEASADSYPATEGSEASADSYPATEISEASTDSDFKLPSDQSEELAITSLYFNGKKLCLNGAEALIIREILSGADYDGPTCDCSAEYTTDDGYGINLTEGYVKYNGGQSDITVEQANIINGIILKGLLGNYDRSVIDKISAALNNSGTDFDIMLNRSYILHGAVLELRSDNNEVDLQLLVYDSADSAHNDATHISNSGFDITYEDGDSGYGCSYSWIDAPHWYCSENVILLYVGHNGSVISALERIMGAQIAGM